jgi:hypothetical protein
MSASFLHAGNREPAGRPLAAVGSALARKHSSPEIRRYERCVFFTKHRAPTYAFTMKSSGHLKKMTRIFVSPLIGSCDCVGLGSLFFPSQFAHLSHTCPLWESDCAGLAERGRSPC